MKPTSPCDVIVIGASAGGIEALKGLFQDLPPKLPASVLIVLHIGNGRLSGLAAILSQASSLPVVDATDGEVLKLGWVYLAVGGHHLTIERGGIIRVQATPIDKYYRPSIDKLFRSAAAIYGPRVAAVVLSGLLRDGTEGLRDVTAAGGVTIAQDPKDAVHSGMPVSAINDGHVQYCLPVRKIATLLVELATYGRAGNEQALITLS